MSKSKIVRGAFLPQWRKREEGGEEGARRKGGAPGGGAGGRGAPAKMLSLKKGFTTTGSSADG